MVVTRLASCYAIANIFPQICPGLNANEIQIPYDKHHNLPSW